MSNTSNTIWGPAIWTFFHTLIEYLKDDAPKEIIVDCFNQFFNICQYLPCPSCSLDATNKLRQIKIESLKTKDDLRKIMYSFHMWVNEKLHKKYFDFDNIQKIYPVYNLNKVIKEFFYYYRTTGNMNLITESFQRDQIRKKLIRWLNNIKPYLININISEKIQS